MARALDAEDGPVVLDPVRDEDVADPLALDAEAEGQQALLEDHRAVEARDDQVTGSVPPRREDDRDLLRREHASPVVDGDPAVRVGVEPDPEVGRLRHHDPRRCGERCLGRARPAPRERPVHLAVPDDRLAPGRAKDPPHLAGRPVAHVEHHPQRAVERDPVRDERTVPVDRLDGRTADELAAARGEAPAPVVLHDGALLVEETVAVPGAEADPVVFGGIVRRGDVGRSSEPVLPGHETDHGDREDPVLLDPGAGREEAIEERSLEGRAAGPGVAADGRGAPGECGAVGPANRGRLGLRELGPVDAAHVVRLEDRHRTGFIGMVFECSPVAEAAALMGILRNL